MLGGWALVSDYWSRQVYGTADGGRGYSQHYDPFFFLSILRHRYWPWLPFLLVSLVLIFKRRSWRIPAIALPFSGAMVLITVISAMRFKFPHYFVPAYPFLDLLTVECIREWLEKRQDCFAIAVISIGLVIPPFLLATPVELAPEMFPALRRFNPIIQSYGTCRDYVLFINGQQPYGGPTDYQLELRFYTNRQVMIANCEESKVTIPEMSPQWIMISGSNLEKCIPEEMSKAYPVRYQFGNQYLLSRIIAPSQATDLTPLMRDLQAPSDCEATPIPKSRYFSGIAGPS